MGANKTSILGDACEAMLAALYIDGGYETAKIFYTKYWNDNIKNAISVNTKDPKTVLQEKAYADGSVTPTYTVQGPFWP